MAHIMQLQVACVCHLHDEDTQQGLAAWLLDQQMLLAALISARSEARSDHLGQTRSSMTVWMRQGQSSTAKTTWQQVLQPPGQKIAGGDQKVLLLSSLKVACGHSSSASTTSCTCRREALIQPSCAFSTRLPQHLLRSECIMLSRTGAKQKVSRWRVTTSAIGWSIRTLWHPNRAWHPSRDCR